MKKNMMMMMKNMLKMMMMMKNMLKMMMMMKNMMKMKKKKMMMMMMNMMKFRLVLSFFLSVLCDTHLLFPSLSHGEKIGRGEVRK